MWVKRVVIGVVVVALLVLLAIIIMDGVPGGPIIVIQPDPDDRGKEQLTTLGYIAHWYVGCLPNPDPVKSITAEKSPQIAHRLNGWVHVGEIAVIVKDSVPPIDPSKIGGIELTLVSGDVLKLRIKEKNAKPEWTFNDHEVGGKPFRDAVAFPSNLLGDIRALNVTGFDPKIDLTPPNGIADVAKIQISYNKYWLYNDCY